MNDSRLFSHWCFESFVPGTILRSKYNAFRDICSATGQGLELLGKVEHIALTGKAVDWAWVVGVTEELIATVRTLVDKLQVMNPVEFMDAQDWSTKIIFYTRLASAPVPVSVMPPYFELLDAVDYAACNLLEPSEAGRTLRIMPSFGQYFCEVNDLRILIDAILRGLDVQDSQGLDQAHAAIRLLLETARLPERLERELDIAAGDLTSGGKYMHVRAYLGSELGPKLLRENESLKAGELRAFWLDAFGARYEPDVIAWRLQQGLADEEVALTVVAAEQGRGTFRTFPSVGGDISALSVRLEQLIPYVVELHVFDSNNSLRPECCRSLYDLICLCFERGLKQIFSFAGEPGKGLAAIKQLRLDVPVVINVFNLGDAFFPSVAGKSVITVEDLRSVPAWSLLMGMGSSLMRWPGDRREPVDGPLPHYSSYAVLSQLYMHCTLRLDCNLFTIECNFDPDHESGGGIGFWFKGGRGSRTERVNRLEVIRRILVADGFLCSALGDYLEATLGDIAEVTMQRSLVTLGLLIAWVQTSGTDMFGREGVEESLKRFRCILTEHRQQ